MPFTREEKDECALLRIEGQMTIHEAAALRDEMVECMKRYKGIIIDMNGVSECDVTAYQILWAARLTSNASGRRFEVHHVPEVCLSTFIKAGLDPAVLVSGACGLKRESANV